MFKAGDRVLVTANEGGEGAGKTAVIIHMCSPYWAHVRFEQTIDGWGEDGQEWGVGVEKLKLAPDDEAAGTDAAPKFKVGDRVRNKRVPEAGVGIIERIKPEGGYAVHYKDTWYGHCHDTDEMLEPTTLRIEAGKFYRTRDGRKVGPMTPWEYAAGDHTWQWETENGAPGCDEIYRADGTSDYNDDLIAEWVGEPPPARPANDSGTAGFTVPLCALEAGPDLTAIGKAYADGYAAGLAARQAA